MSLRVVILGGGLMGRWHAHAARKAGGTVVAVVDPDPAAQLPPTATLEDALALGPDVVHVCSPEPDHADQAAAALSAGAHVLVDKPLAPDVARTLALVEQAHDHGLTLTPVHQMTAQRWRADVESLGDLVSIEHTLHSAGGGGADLDRIAASIACHPLSIVAELLGPAALEAVRWSVDRAGPGELRALGSSAGCAVGFAISMSARPPRNDLVVSGSRATLHADLFHGFGAVDRVSADRIGKLARPFLRGASTLGRASANLGRRAAAREPAFPGLDALVAQTYAAIRNEADPPLSVAHCLAVARARDVILGALP